ncbi:MAG: DUF5131 family protein [Planctomycetota bacterium]
MAEKTIIAWTDKTFNALWGCTKVSDGCKNCYAATLSARYGHDVWGPKKPRRTFGQKHWLEPAKWNAEAQADGQRLRVFCGSMFDWAEDHPTNNATRPKLWETIRANRALDWQLLTKRPENIARMLPPDWSAEAYPHVWLGTSIEDMRVAKRADHLRQVPARVRFISYEPALGPLDSLNLAGIHWVIQGGESGPGYRPMPIEWPRAMRAACERAGVAYFFKQSASYRTEMGIELDGEIVRNYPPQELPRHLVAP